MKWKPKKGEVPAFDKSIRLIKGKSKGWIDTRLVTSETRLIRQLTLQEWALYAFLCTMADSKGISWYSLEKISDFLHIGKESILTAREGLRKKSLINFITAGELARLFPQFHNVDNRYVFYQVLELPIGQITVEVNRSLIDELTKASDANRLRKTQVIIPLKELPKSLAEPAMSTLGKGH